MREIKFRAWDKCQKHWSGMRDVFIHSGIYYFNVDIKDVALMQYTGLKDKNGTEIYEGDIFEIDGIRSFVVYWETAAGFRFNSYMPLGYIDRLYDASHVGEVIGNIWENPEGGK